MSKLEKYILLNRSLVTAVEVRKRLGMKYSEPYVRRILANDTSYSKGNVAKLEILQCAETIIKAKAKAALEAA